MPLRLLNSPTLQIILAIVCGVLLGVLDPLLAIDMKPLSDGFIRVIGWFMPWMMFLLVSSGVAGLQTRRRGLVGKAFMYFQVMGLLSLCLGCVVTLAFNPGAHMALRHDATVVHSELLNADFSWASVGAVVTHAFTQSLVMQVMLAGLLFGIIVGRMGGTERGDALRAFLEKAVALLFRVLRVILRFAPLAAFGAMAFSIGRFGPAAALPLFKFVAVMYLACGLFMLLVLATVARLAGARLWRLVVYVKDELLLVVFTGSSVAALPGLIDKMQKLGCDQQLVRLILTTGYTFNLSGSNVYLTTAVLFLAQMAGIDLSAAELLTLLLISLLTSLGSTSMAGSAFLTLIATLNLLHLVPLESVGLLLGVERLMKCRSLTNVLGNCVACLAIARWQNALDRPVMCKELAAGATL
jgi:aerobic C4-dicarboxylate transport protein